MSCWHIRAVVDAVSTRKGEITRIPHKDIVPRRHLDIVSSVAADEQIITGLSVENVVSSQTTNQVA